MMMTGDWGHVYRIDKFRVPPAARPEFLAGVGATSAVLEQMPGFVQHMVFEQTSGPGELNFVTMAVWENAEAIALARRIVAARYAESGFDPAEVMARLGIQADIGEYTRMDGVDAALAVAPR